MQLGAKRTINRPADEVFEFLADAANNPRWQRGMVSCEWTTDEPIAVGSTYSQQARFMGRAIVSTFVVTRWDPGETIEIETVESTFPIKVMRRVSPIDDRSCIVTAEISGGPDGGVLRLLAPFMTRRARKSVDGDYDRLVQLLEASASSD